MIGEMSSSSDTPLWSLPISKRPAHGSLSKGILWAILFNTTILLVQTLQLILLPLYFYPSTRHTFHRLTKEPFGKLCVAINQIFAPTRFIVTGVESGAVQRDRYGTVTNIELPERGIWMANHQTLCDWIYIWTFSYLTKHSSSIVITLKASLRKIPIIGWACHFYGFIFLQRKWANDQGPFKKQLRATAQDLKASKKGEGDDELGKNERLAFLIFVEGTTLTGNEKPKSAAYAEKIGVKPFDHVLLPRSTGIFYALRTLSAELPDLQLIDLTIGYPGTHLPQPADEKPTWPEDFYSLTNWWKGVGPPEIHCHVRVFDVRKEVPLGDVNGGDEEPAKKEFDLWLRNRWGEKDELMKNFVKDGRFEEEQQSVVWPVELRNPWIEWIGVLAYGVPFMFGLLVWGSWRSWHGTHLSEEVVERVVKPCCAAAAAAAQKKGLGEL